MSENIDILVDQLSAALDDLATNRDDYAQLDKESLDRKLDPILDLIDKLASGHNIDTSNLKGEILRVKAELEDERSNLELKQELAAEQEKESGGTRVPGIKKKPEQKQNNISQTLKMNLRDLSNDVIKCISDQIQRAKQEIKSFTFYNMKSEDKGVILKGSKKRVIPQEIIPSITVFFDRSMSWSKFEQQAVSDFMKFLEKKKEVGEIILNKFYFSSIVTDDPNDSRLGHNTGAWEEIIKKIKETGTKNVFLMTDNDMVNQGASNPGASRVIVDGFVWILWKIDDLNWAGSEEARETTIRGFVNGCKAISEKIVGKANHGLNKQYVFCSNDIKDILNDKD